MNRNLRIERASEPDLGIFAKMERQPDTEEFVVPYSLKKHRACFGEELIIYLRILNAQKLVGFFILALDIDGLSVEFRRIVIEKSERGIGQDAIRLMESYCLEDLGRERIWLDVFAANTRAIHLYEKLEFQSFQPNPNDSSSLLYYEKFLRDVSSTWTTS